MIHYCIGRVGGEKIQNTTDGALAFVHGLLPVLAGISPSAWCWRRSSALLQQDMVVSSRRASDIIEPCRRFFDFVVWTDWSRPALTITSTSSVGQLRDYCHK